MKKNNVLKILFIIIIFLILNFLNCNMVLGVQGLINPDDYNPENTITSADTEMVFSKAGIILGAVRNISVIVSVIVLMVIGLKYIIGSAEEKANYKATMIPYIIGCIMAVAGTSLVSFIYNAVH